jgi:AcrR family transcriptional regulator
LEKKEALFKAAAGLFARNGFEATTTVQIANAAKATEPMIYYHFNGKDDLFTQIFERASKQYFSRLKHLPRDMDTQFEKIANLISLHFEFVHDMPNETYLIASTCPAKLNDPQSICKRIVDKQRFWLTDYLTTCIEKGVRGGEFQTIAVSSTVNIIIALLNGLMRQRSLGLGKVEGLKEETIAFCRRSLMKKTLRIGNENRNRSRSACRERVQPG